MPFILCRLKRQPGEKLDSTRSYGGESSSGVTHDGVPTVPQHVSLEDTNPEVIKCTNKLSFKPFQYLLTSFLLSFFLSVSVVII